MNAQRIRLIDGEPFAIRIIEPQPSESLRLDGKIIPIPEFGAIATNVLLWDTHQIKWRNLKEPELIEGIKATIRAEVWAVIGGKPHHQTETWFATHVPPGFKNLAAFIQAFRVSEQKQFQSQSHLKNPRVTVEKREDEITNVNACARTAADKLLRKRFPRFFKAYDNRQESATVTKAYIADLWATLGHAPTDVADIESLIQDKGFTTWLSIALQSPGQVEEWEWQLVLGWIPDGLHALSDAALATAMNKRTGEDTKPGAWRKRATRLKLPSSLKIGRPENSNLLPPE